jgi:pyruvate,water dikinase
MADTDTVTFEPPGAGFWALDRSHYPCGATPIGQWLITESFLAGFSRVFSESGIPAEGIEARFVNGFFYTRLRPLIGPDKPPKKLPPNLVLKLAMRLHPEFRARNKRAIANFEARTSIEVAERWANETRPRIRATNLKFQNVDLANAGDEQLAQMIGDLLTYLRDNFELHFWLHGHDLGPVARYLYACIGWGLDPVEAIDALAGASPTTAVPLATLVKLRSMADEAGVELTTLGDVRAVSPESSQLLDEYLEEHGHVLATGYDITALTLLELPGVIVESIKSATPPEIIDHEAIATSLRAQIGVDDRERFDALRLDARAVMDMRDDNGPLVAEWPSGLLRLALLEAGTRLANRGELELAEHALELTPDEARTIFDGGLPSAAAISERAELRGRMAMLTPPDSLGDPEPEPPLDVMPPALAEAVATIQVAIKYMGMDDTAKADPLTGAGIGRETYVGRARAAASADDAIESLEPGDVLVVRATSPAFNAVLAIAGGVVTADGGLLSHAAVLARELGIPAVIGAPGALDIPDGSMIEIDPVRGAIRVLEPS